MSLFIVILGPLIILGVLGGALLIQKINVGEKEADYTENTEKHDAKASGRTVDATTMRQKAERMREADLFLQQVTQRIAENLKKRSEEESEGKEVSCLSCHAVEEMLELPTHAVWVCMWLRFFFHYHLHAWTVQETM